MSYEIKMKSFLTIVNMHRNKFIEFNKAHTGHSDREIFNTYWLYTYSTQGTSLEFVSDKLEVKEDWKTLPSDLKSILD